MHGRGKDVVGGLRHIDVIVGVNGVFTPQNPARQLDGPVGDHFIDVHVALGAAPGHPDMDREIALQLALDDFLGSPQNEPGFIMRQFAQFMISQGRSLLDHGQGPDHLLRHQVIADGKVGDRPLGFRAPIAVRRDLNFPQAVTFPSLCLRVQELHDGSSPSRL